MNTPGRIFLNNGQHCAVPPCNATPKFSYMDKTRTCWGSANSHFTQVILPNIPTNSCRHSPLNIREMSLQCITCCNRASGVIVWDGIYRASPNDAWLMDSAEKLRGLGTCPPRILFCCCESRSHVTAIPCIRADHRPA